MGTSAAIAYQLTQAGVSVEQVAELVALSYIPQTSRFLWAPAADTTLSRKTWYLLAGLVSALGIFVTGRFLRRPPLPLLYAAVLVSNGGHVSGDGDGKPDGLQHTAETAGRAGGWFRGR